MLFGFIVLYLLITILIGWYVSRRVRTTRDFVIAGRNLPTLVAASALFATWFGSETILGASSEFVQHGMIGVVEDPFGAALCLVLVGFFFARPLYKLNVITINDFYRIRFGRAAELVSALFMIPSYFGWIAAQLVALAFILKTLIGLPLIYGIIICTLVVVFYTYIGGMWAVSITDTVQTVVIIVGLGILAWSLLHQAGGISVLAEQAPERFFSLLPHRERIDPWHYLAAWITIGLGSIPQQDVFQRVLSSKSANTAVRSSLLSGLMYLSIGFLPMLIALSGASLYPELNTGDRQQLIPMIVLNHGSLAMQIFFFGALLSAILSTTSGAILAPATVLGENLIKPLFKELSDRQLLRIMRFGVVLVAICSATMAGLNANIYDLVAQSSSLSLVSLFIPLACGLYWRKASKWGAVLSMMLGMITWIWFEYLRHTELPSLLPGLLASILGMLLGTLLVPNPKEKEIT
jgi:SSS family transporter